MPLTLNTTIKPEAEDIKMKIAANLILFYLKNFHGYIIFRSLSLSIQITRLKIDHNPFAKGFRDSGGGRSKEKK